MAAGPFSVGRRLLVVNPSVNRSNNVNPINLRTMNRDDDPELEALRQKRLQQLMAEQGLTGSGEENTAAQARQEEAKREADERRQALLRQILEPQAKERLSRISLVKPEKARQIEDMILAQARGGRVDRKISEDTLISILEQVKEKTESRSSKVTFTRRRNILDDDDE